MVILGAGMGGMTLASELARTEGSYELILIDKNDYRIFLPSIPFIATGFENPENAKLRILDVLDKRVKFIRSRVLRIFPERKLLKLEDSSIEFEILVIAAGARPDYHNISGAKEYSLPLQSIEDAQAIYKHINSLVQCKERQVITVIGGGPTGITFVSLLYEFLKKHDCLDKLSIVILEAKKDILPGWSNELRQVVREKLRTNKISLLTRSPILKLERGKIYLPTAIMASSLIIWTAGIRGAYLYSTPKLESTDKDRIRVDEYLQCVKYNNIYCIGDSSGAKDRAGTLYPQLAQVAVQQAKYLSDLIPKYIKNQNHDLERFEFDLFQKFLQIGYEQFVGEVNNEIIQGSTEQIIDQLRKAYEMSGDRRFIQTVYEIEREELRTIQNKLRKFIQDIYKSSTSEHQ